MATKVTNSAFESEVRRLTLRLRGLQTVSLALTYGTLWLFAWGTVVLILRGAVPGINRQVLLSGLAGALPAVLLAFVFGSRRAPDPQAVRALLDRKNRCGGLLMTAAKAELGEWRELMPKVTSPVIRWRGGRRVALFAAALLFLVAGFLVPVRFGGGVFDQPLDVEKQVEQLAAEIETLKDQDIIDQSRVESLESELDSVREEASGRDPAKTLEALDHLNQTLSDAAAEAAEKMAQASQELGQSQALAEALTTDGSALDGKLATEAMKELSRMAEAAAADDAQFSEQLPNDLLEGLKAGSLTSEQLKKLAATLGKRKGEIARRLGKLREANLINLGTMKKCEGTGDVDADGLAAFLAENGENMSVAEIMGLWGKGGVDRGRGDAPMTWTEGTSEQGAKFKEHVIPPSAIAGFKDSQLVGRSAGAPSIEKGGAAKSGALGGASAGGGSAFTHTILPRHKGAVKSYFER